MDCEKFEQHLMDALYDELDELTHAAFKRHMDGCSRCSSTFAGLRATRDVGVLPLEEPSAGLEDKILAAARTAQLRTPWPRKALRVLAWAGSHAMRPQLAMAALFVLVIGSSLLLLRPKSMSMSSPVRVTERGVPAPDPAAEASPDPAMPMPSQLAMAEPPSAGAPAAAIDGAREEREQKKSEAAEGKGSDAKAALAEARAVRQKSGCGAAVKAYDDVGSRFPATVVAAEAMWEAADCYKTMGDSAKARELYQALRSYASYRDRAEAELNDATGNMMNNSGSQVASRAAAGAPPPMAAAAPAAKAAKKASAAEAQAQAPQASPPAATVPGGSTPATKPAAPAPPPVKAAPAAADAYSY
jgi:hypothetical protein